MIRFFCCLAAALWSAAAVAADGGECARIDDAGERLLCYDGLFRTETRTEGHSPESKWELATKTSKIDDTTIVFLRVESQDTFPGRYGRDQQHAALWLRCMENSTALFLELGDHFLADTGGFGDVTFRIDMGKAFTRSLVASTDHSALGLWSGAQSIDLIKKLLQADQLVVRATPYSESPITATFPVAGLDDKIVPLRTACGW